jgi:hypothetical protein
MTMGKPQRFIGLSFLLKVLKKVGTNRSQASWMPDFWIGDG